MVTQFIRSHSVELDMMSIQIHSFFQEAWSPEDNAKLSFAALEKNLLLVRRVLTPLVLMKIQPFRRNSKI
jgi:hypothetical protein